MKIKYLQRGTITPMLLIVASAFIIVIYALVFILALQFDFSQRQIGSDKALQIAEAGVNYYNWHLGVNQGDYQDGTGQPGPYIHDYLDPSGASIGKYSLTIDAPTSSDVITITSTGWTNQFPRVKRKIEAKYGKIVLTKYAFLHNSNLFFGTDIVVNGPVYSNGGIRQDGTNSSTVESAKQTYTCGLESGCSNPLTKPGVWGNGKLDSLWSYPKAPIDFDSFKVDFNQMKSAAQSTGIYLGPSNAQGYHIVFTSDGNFQVYKVTGVAPIKGYSIENECETLNEEIVSQALVTTRSVSNTPIIFAEDNVWVEGVVNGKTTIAAARFPLGTFNANIWIPNNLTYLAKDGNHKLGLVVEKDIILTRDVPDYLSINGALLAQNGRVIRHHYGYFGCKSSGNDKNKNEFNFYGSIISNFPSYWNFSPSGVQTPASGFNKTTLDYDSTNYGDPPPYFPSWGGYQFLSWKELKVN